jgi:hypothetical protein
MALQTQFDPREGAPIAIEVTDNTTVCGEAIFKGQRLKVSKSQYNDLAAAGKVRKLEKDETLEYELHPEVVGVASQEAIDGQKKGAKKAAAKGGDNGGGQQ